MSFFSSLKRSLGLDDSEVAEDNTLYADTAEAVSSSSDASATEDGDKAAGEASLEFDRASQDLIFEKVVEIFNKSLPPFLAQSVDKQAQIKYLREAMDSGVKAYLDSLSSKAEAYCEQRWHQTRESMAAELDAIKAKADDIEKKSADIQQKQLSADRQKRALSDRLHDLESQVVRLEADREQYELENRSLVNRLKVAGVQQEDVDSARAEIERLNTELRKLRENPGDVRAAEADALRIQIDEMRGAIDSLKEQNRVSAQMLDDMRKNLAGANKRLAERDKQLKEANEIINSYNIELDKKMAQVDERLAADAETIKKQKKAMADRDSQIESLKETIARNLRQQARREAELQSRIKALAPAQEIAQPEEEKPAQPAAPEEAFEVKPPVISEADLSEIEKTFESEEWFTKNPPAETPSMRKPDSDSEFGYKDPPRKNPDRPDHPSQLSLF